MPKLAQRPGAEIEQLSPRARLDRLSWDDLRVFLGCAEANSFRDAAKILNMSVSTVSRRMDRLEHVLDIPLFHRLPEGVVLTDQARSIAQSARAMHQMLCQLERTHPSSETEVSGDVTIAVTEGLGSYWVTPKLIAFQKSHPRTTINLYCAMESVDVLRLEADIAIQFIKPTESDLIAFKLGKLHLYPFAARSYLDTYGTPKSFDDMRNHRLVEQVAPNLDVSALRRYFRLDPTSGFLGIRTNTSTAHLYAIEKGAGIGGLPTFAAALGAPVEPIDLGDGYSLDIWLTYHPDTRKSRHKAQAIDWIKQIFDPAVYPWFREKLIPPRELAALLPPEADINDGRGFAAVEALQFDTLLKRHSRR